MPFDSSSKCASSALPCMQESGKFDKCLELVGTTTLLDSLKCVSGGGIVCMTGIVGNSWTLEVSCSHGLSAQLASCYGGVWHKHWQMLLLPLHLQLASHSCMCTAIAML